ncbi:MAG: glycosyltransferase [Polyangiaceae bacterium]
MSRTGIVIIGRNEGERLRACLKSVAGENRVVVYVDSGSTDGSRTVAEGLGARVVDLDCSVPFTAARARNRGFEELLAMHPELELVQFVDGDCEVQKEWLALAESTLDAAPHVAVVCGRRRERFPDASIYNRLCDIEWNTPVGEALACGGDAMFRVSVLRSVGGYDPSLIAGEEPELCLRIRRLGFKILRIDAEMTLHDAAMTTFRQFLKRAQRTGYAYAEGAARYGSAPERHWVREQRNGLFWGVALPTFVVFTAPMTRGASSALLAGYGVSFLRTRRHLLKRGFSSADASLYATFCTLSKFAECAGQATYWYRRFAGKQQKLIEYKS